MKNKLVAVLFIIVFVLLIVVVCSLLNDDNDISDVGDVRLPDISATSALETMEPSATVTTPTPVPATPAPTPVPMPEPTPTPDVALPSPGVDEAVPSPDVNTPAAGTSLGSGSFKSESPVPLNIIARWEAKSVDSSKVSVTVDVSAESYSLQLMATKTLHMSLNGEYVTVDVPAVDYDGKEMTENKLGSYTFELDLPAGSSNSYTLAVEWQFGGVYFNQPVDVLECGGTISISR